MNNRELEEWDIQTNILKANGYTTEEINNRSFYDRHLMIRNNCEGYETGNIYYPDEDGEEW